MNGQKFRKILALSVMLPLFLFLLMHSFLVAENTSSQNNANFASIEKEVKKIMDDGNIPGLSVIIIDGDKPLYIKGFGYADKERKLPVTAETLFELGSTSKAFTGLAAVNLEAQGKIKLDDPVSKYLPWFSVKYAGKPCEITIRQMLYHTSGIPTDAIAKIPRGADDKILENTVRGLVGFDLKTRPGTMFEYSTVNYDVVGLIIQMVSGVTFESYVMNDILKPLGMNNSMAGVDQSNPPVNMAVGYKIGFFKPRPYVAPVYRANIPAGYVVSNSNDIARWLQFQMGAIETPLTPLLKETHTADLSVAPPGNTLTSYAIGWFVNQIGTASIFHGGLNPNFTSYFVFSQKDKRGVAILANSNTNMTGFIGTVVYNWLYGDTSSMAMQPDDSLDKTFTVLSLMVGFSLLVTLLFYCSIVYDLIKKNRAFEGLTFRKLLRFVGVLILFLPFLLAIYLIPKTLTGASWDMAIVWSPLSFQVAIILILTVMLLSYIGVILSTLFPHKNKYLKSLPTLLVISLISGVANAVIMFIITGSIYMKNNIGYIVFYFLLTLVLYITGRKVVQTKLLGITVDIVYDLRMKLIGKIFFTSYQRFERIDGGQVLATLSNDTGQIANSAGLFVGILNNTITVIAVFLYLGTIAFWATAVTLLVIVIVAATYYVLGREAGKYLELARESQNVYLGLLNGMIAGFKELSLHIRKKMNYKGDLEVSCNEFRNTSQIANVKLINAFLVGESLLIIILGAVGFLVPRLFPEIKDVTLMSFIIALLYLIGPINYILGSMPMIIQIQVAWNRVKTFIDAVPANMSEEDAKKELPVPKNNVQTLEAHNLFFDYKTLEAFDVAKKPALAAKKDEKSPAPLADGEIKEPVAEENAAPKTFSVGPLSLDAKRGEIVFIVGGNGSGKTTLAKLLTGLYTSDGGYLRINGVDIPNFQMGEYFSVVFGDFNLFKKLYDADLTGQEQKVTEHIKLLELTGKVDIKDNAFTTIDLSGGQKKRLALLQCYLEDSPIYLFDEVAADQDPQFRKFFYRTLLGRMKAEGKIVMAITHDDHYFDVADKVIKMDFGQIDFVTKGTELHVTK